MSGVIDAGPTVATVFVRALLKDWTLNLHSLLEFLGQNKATSAGVVFSPGLASNCMTC
jgi:hypothetical protein